MRACKGLYYSLLYRFGVIPPVIYKLSSLETLLISDNQVSELNAAGLQGLTKLASLDLQNNNLGSIPPELGNCTSLRYVNNEPYLNL